VAARQIILLTISTEVTGTSVASLVAPSNPPLCNRLLACGPLAFPLKAGLLQHGSLLSWCVPVSVVQAVFEFTLLASTALELLTLRWCQQSLARLA